MAEKVIRKIAIFDKDQSKWSSKDIGASASNISLSKTIAGINSNVEDVLDTLFPDSKLTAGILESNENGQLITSSNSSKIINFFKENGDLKDLNDNLNNLTTSLNTKISSGEQFDLAIEDYLSRHSGDEGIVTVGLTPAEISNLVYPVGTVLTLFSEQTPLQLGLGGTWEQIEGTFLYPSAGEINRTGGSLSQTPTITLNRTKDVTIKPIRHTPYGLINTNFIQQNEVSGYGLSSTGQYRNQVVLFNEPGASPSVTFSGSESLITAEIDQQPNFIASVNTISILPPYITVHMWKRTGYAEANQFYVVGEDEDSATSGIVQYIVNEVKKEIGDVILTPPTIAKWQSILGS